LLFSSGPYCANGSGHVLSQVDEFASIAQYIRANGAGGYLAANLASALNFTVSKDGLLVKQLACEIGDTIDTFRVFNISAEEDRDDIVIFRKDRNEIIAFRTTSSGALTSTVSAKKGIGLYVLNLEEAKQRFQIEKTFWIARFHDGRVDCI
jgi:DNA repair protein RadC